MSAELTRILRSALYVFGAEGRRLPGENAIAWRVIDAITHEEKPSAADVIAIEAALDRILTHMSSPLACLVRAERAARQAQDAGGKQ